MTTEGFYWATITSILFSMLFARKEGVATTITIASVGMLYASGSVGSIYTTVYNAFENYCVIDIMFLSVLLGIIYIVWIVFFSLSELVAVDKNLKRYLSDVGITFLSFIGVGILGFIYLLLCYNASSVVCSLAIPIIIFAFALGDSSSKEKGGDDFLTFALICSIMVFGIMCWFNNLLENYNIVEALGYQFLEYSYGASFVSATLLTIPIFLAIRFIGYKLIEFDNIDNQDNQDNIELSDTTPNSIKNETE